MTTTFKGIDNAGFGGYSLTDQLLYNLKWFLDSNLVRKGAYNLYLYSSSSYYDDTESQLHPVSDERYENGKVWEGQCREWVWESGLAMTSGTVDPFRVSGVYVNTNFHPTGTTGAYSFHVDYLNGRIIFDQPRSLSDDIRAEYTGRCVHTGFADDPEFRLMMLNAADAFSLDSVPSGIPAKEHQLWLPSVFIEITNGSQKGLQLGGGQIKTRYAVFHIFADNPQTRNLLVDWLDFQSRSTFFLTDLNSITFPFDRYGDILDDTTNWEQLIISNPWKKIRISDGTASNIDSLNSNVFRGRVRWKIEIDIGGI